MPDANTRRTGVDLQGEGQITIKKSEGYFPMESQRSIVGQFVKRLRARRRNTIWLIYNSRLASFNPATGKFTCYGSSRCNVTGETIRQMCIKLNKLIKEIEKEQNKTKKQDI